MTKIHDCPVTSLLSTLQIDVVTIKMNSKSRFKEQSEQQKIELLEGKDKISTQKATAGALNLLKDFITEIKHVTLDDIIDDRSTLASILYNLYAAIKPQKSEDYSVQSLKCIRSGLARHFRGVTGVDIIKDCEFVKANEMFRAVTVNSKKKGKGVRPSYPTITPIDMERIVEYFNYDHVTKPDPKRLQKHLLFYIVYYFCRRGRENLYTMTKETFKKIVEEDRTEYLIQAIDELDKNHGPDDPSATNQGRMYGNDGN